MVNVQLTDIGDALQDEGSGYTGDHARLPAAE